MYHIQVVGAGYAGSRIAAHFREKKQKVWALTHSGKRNAEFEALGITPIIADLTKPDTLEGILPAHFIVICPAPGEKKDEEAYRKIYLEGIGNYLAAIRKNPKPNLIVYLSSTGVYSDKKGEWVDETTPPEPDTEKGRILLEAEAQVLNSGFPSVIFRLAGIYGPGRNRLSRPSVARDDSPDRWLNHIHVDDIAGAMPVIFNKGQAGSLYLGVDGEPILQSEFNQWLADKNVILRAKPEESSRRSFARSFCSPRRGSLRMTSEEPGRTRPLGKRCSNAKLKALGYQFKYPAYREGYEAIIKETSSV